MSRKVGNWTFGVTVHPQALPVVHTLFNEMRAQRVSKAAMRDLTGVKLCALYRWSKQPGCTICTSQMCACLKVLGMEMTVVRVARHEGAGA